MSDKYIPTMHPRRTNMSAEKRARIIKVYREGLDIKSMVERFGVDSSSIWRILSEEGIVERRQHKGASAT